MKKNGITSWQSGTPTSISFYITSDTSNIGAEIVPKIWTATLDSLQTSLIIGNEVASSFIPTIIDSSMLSSLLTLPLDNGTAVFSGLNQGKYIVGFESTLPNPNGKSLILGRDTIGEMVQPSNSSFVYFGHDTNWYAHIEMPMIHLNLSNMFFGGPNVRPCIPVVVAEELKDVQEIQIYPNPSNGSFTLENKGSVKMVEVYNVNGQKVQVELFNNQLDLSEQPRGIYLLRVQLASGEVVSKKLMKL